MKEMKRRSKLTVQRFVLIKTLLANKIARQTIYQLANTTKTIVERVKQADSINQYFEMNRVVQKRHLEKVRQQKMFTKKVENTITAKEAVEKTSKKFDQYNTLMAKITALEYTVAKIYKLLEEKEVKKFKLF